MRGSTSRPQGESEVHLAQLWQELLGVSRIGRHDNFFELGGHSLLAVQLIGRIRMRFGHEIPLSRSVHALDHRSLARSEN